MKKEDVKKWCNKFFIDNDKDFELFDFESEYDEKVSAEENKVQLRAKLKEFLPTIPKTKKEAEIMPKEQYEELVIQEITKAEKQATLEFEKALRKIEKDKTTTIIEDMYFIPKQFAKMVANGNAKGFILYGEAGLGKSYTIMRAFRECKKEFVYLSGHITPLELYQYLFTHRKENIILDDVNVLDNEINLNMLKSCLNDNSRIVCYNTSSSKLRVPNRFIFEGTICLLLNDKPKNNENLKAVESRVLNHELRLNYQDKIKIIFELAKQNYKSLTEEDKNKIVNWIKENTSEATKNLNLRVLFLIYEMYLFDKNNWEKMAKKILITDEYLEMIIQGVGCDEWCEISGKGRATYFRYKKSIKVS
jgi:hypothetical protein